MQGNYFRNPKVGGYTTEQWQKETNSGACQTFQYMFAHIQKIVTCEFGTDVAWKSKRFELLFWRK